MLKMIHIHLIKRNKTIILLIKGGIDG